MRRVATLAVALLALPACDKSEQKAGPQTAEQVAEEMSEMKMEPGQWEATSEIVSATGPGLPKSMLDRMVGQKSTLSNCVTPEQAARPSANFLAAQKNLDCTYQDFSMEDGRVTGRMSCTGGNLPGRMAMNMNGRYDPRSYEMTMDMKAAMPAGVTLTMQSRTIGRRTGECAAGAAK